MNKQRIHKKRMWFYLMGLYESNDISCPINTLEGRRIEFTVTLRYDEEIVDIYHYNKRTKI